MQSSSAGQDNLVVFSVNERFARFVINAGINWGVVREVVDTSTSRMNTAVSHSRNDLRVYTQRRGSEAERERE